MSSIKDNKFSLRARIALLQKSMRVGELAQKASCSRFAASSVINGSLRYPRVRKKVAAILKIAA